LRKHVVGEPSYDNFEQKKNDSLLDVHLAITLEILAGILAHIGSLRVACPYNFPCLPRRAPGVQSGWQSTYRRWYLTPKLFRREPALTCVRGHGTGDAAAER
jgi:hypothetical protein